VRNDGGETSSLRLTSTAVVDDENGCNRPESLVDATCSGDNTGELGREMTFTVSASADPQSPLWGGTLYDLEHGVVLDSGVAPDQVDDFIIKAELPASSGNETQTDRLAFTLVIGLNGAPGVAVEGTKITRNPPSTLDQIASHLPFTGSPAMRLAAAGLSLLLAGTALILLATQRRRRLWPV
jgi:hypothetical protein